MTEKLVIDQSNMEDQRFSRFELISWWSREKLDRAKILVVGAGAIGNEIIKNLALLGVKNLLIADMDKIENSNLSRSCLYREKDNGRDKSVVACEAAKDIYPQINAVPFVGNIVHDLGRGVYHWADIILGGLDNREARVSINANAFKVSKPWIDGAIEVLNGVARVFDPADGPCYECTMSEVDWKMLEARRSCALLSRDEIMEGKTPTTPTMASIVAGVQVQEAVKYLHGMDMISGKGWVFNGSIGDIYTVSYKRKEDCFAHDSYGEIENLDLGVEDVTVGQFLQRIRGEMGPDAVIELDRDIIQALTCMHCGAREEVFASLGKIDVSRGICPECKQQRTPETVSTLGYDDLLNDKTFAEIGVPYFDIVSARIGMESRAFLFNKDAEKILKSLPIV